MPIPDPVHYPPFNITRAGHVRVTVRDLDAARDFYTSVYGLIVSDEADGALYLRGVEEVCHHSLVLTAAGDGPLCERIGLRVQTEEELDKAHDWFCGEGLGPAWVEQPWQGRTLHVTDPCGVPLELCASMTAVPRLGSAVDRHRGGVALRFDHFQILVPDAQAACDFYTRLGFRVSDYVETPDGALVAAFMYRKDIPWDLVFFAAKGPRMHHFAYITPNAVDMFRACDIAGIRGYGEAVERGPGRHSMGHVQYVYFRDPDGHRSELVLDAPHHMTDLENEPVQWTPASIGEKAWGLPAQRAWFLEASRFPGVEPVETSVARGALTLEDYLSARTVVA
ncbi:VOC family protein [Microbaculum marinum]|uniref:VOC family protein n=1 Tax=Microbaculum marinum TaxID=1764581 RepID=A0AAW9RNU2_9HYPH